MKTVQIQATKFFELLKLHNTSMWSVFAEMIDGEEKELVFLNDQAEVLFHYTLPKTLEQLQKDQVVFSEEYAKKIEESN